ncbi:hypothetical protein [Flavobacterium sp. 3HN19-14]|uniref:hypothetical protein n=1 Tax=Flavobacterium sp. 3HN19-14 TaxID=3448133 RepID=UPI003EE0CD47
MKRIILFLAVAASGLFVSCEGDRGPAGPASEVFEVNATFSAANNFAQTYALNPEIYTSDNLLVYELVNTNDGIDTWALLPQVYYFADGQAQYNFNYSFDQFTILTDADFDMTLLPASFTNNKVFRVVIVPGYFSKGVAPVDYSDYDAVIKTFKIDDSHVTKLNPVAKK